MNTFDYLEHQANSKTYLTIDLDYFHTPKQFKNFLETFKFNVKNIDFQRNHHSLAKNVIDSGCVHVINLDTHDDLNPDYFSEKKLHCGNWGIYLMVKNKINSFTWVKPVRNSVECADFYEGSFWNNDFMPDIHMHKTASLGELYAVNDKITNIGVCVSPNYHSGNNCEIITGMFINFCEANKITLNKTDARSLYNKYKNMLMIRTDDDHKRLLAVA